PRLDGGFQLVRADQRDCDCAALIVVAGKTRCAMDQYWFPFRPRDNRMAGFEDSSGGGNDEFDGAVLLLPALNHVAFPFGFPDRLMNSVKLQELSVILA